MARLIEATVLTQPGEVAPTFLPAGSELPAWAEKMVGRHLLEGDGPATPVEPEPEPESEPVEAEKPRPSRSRKG